jgi:hypothetical protein
LAVVPEEVELLDVPEPLDVDDDVDEGLSDDFDEEASDDFAGVSDDFDSDVVDADAFLSLPSALLSVR